MEVDEEQTWLKKSRRWLPLPLPPTPYPHPLPPTPTPNLAEDKHAVAARVHALEQLVEQQHLARVRGRVKMRVRGGLKIGVRGRVGG